MSDKPIVWIFWSKSDSLIYVISSLAPPFFLCRLILIHWSMSSPHLLPPFFFVVWTWFTDLCHLLICSPLFSLSSERETGNWCLNSIDKYSGNCLNLIKQKAGTFCLMAKIYFLTPPPSPMVIFVWIWYNHNEWKLKTEPDTLIGWKGLSDQPIG